jgi:hypothetical protein
MVMYKYLFNKEIHTALGLHDAVRLADFVLPEGIDPVSHFIVRLWQWDEEDQDYSIEVFDAPGHQVFKEYDDALNFFNDLATDYPEVAGEEIKLELVQYHRGKISTLRSKILFPAILAMEP